MNFKNVIQYNLSGDIAPYFSLFSHSELTSDIIDIIKTSMLFVTSEAAFHNKSKVKLNVLVRNSNAITISFDENDLGNQADFAFVNYKILEQKNEIEQCIIFIEEFVHHFWDTHDEIYTKSVVCNILQNQGNDITYDQNNGYYLYKSQLLTVG